MKSVALSIPLILFLQFTVQAQTHSRFIIVDQFGYLPDVKKIAVLKDPQTGFDASESFSPGLIYSVINATTGEKVYTANRTVWGGGTTDASSGDKVWHFDFTPVIVPGTYYILDEEKNLKSYEFMISPNIYNEILRQAMRFFFISVPVSKKKLNMQVKHGQIVPAILETCRIKTAGIFSIKPIQIWKKMSAVVGMTQVIIINIPTGPPIM